MPVYNYAARDSSGKIRKGNENAINRIQLVNILKQKGLVPVEISEAKAGAAMSSSFSKYFRRRVKIRDIAVFCRQFSTILRAGVTVLKGIDLLRKQTENATFKEVLNNVYEEIQKGTILSEAMRKQKAVFPAILINMVEAGEISGTLDASMEKMAEHFEKDFKLRQKVKSALTYPIIICVVCFLAVIVLLTVVVPQFAEMFKTLDSELPATTKILLDTGNFMKSFWYLVIAGFIGLIIGFIYFKKSDFGSRFIDKYALKLPIFSPVVKKIIAARFTRTMSTMLSSGIPLIKSLEVCERVVGNKTAEQMLNKVRGYVVQGGSLADHIGNLGLFPIMVPHMISVGEETGAIDKMLEKTADFFDEEVDASITQMTTLIEPAILGVMALIVGFIVISIIQPMFQMYENIH
ncbi:MAG: type II secretion system F family protein [Ignavibacteriales bacterium]